MKTALLVAASTGLALGCASRTSDAAPGDFGSYWYRGKAEVTSYELSQARYGELHPGHAVLVFVTEPFSRTKQVKLDAPSRAGNDAVSVMKLNFSRKFNTGVYPYSVMTSVFSPVEGGPTLKTTSTVQEWCGHVFQQLNRSSTGYSGHLFSYFESEGDRDLSLPDVLLEDQIWTQIRLDPSQLPQGEVRIVPGATHVRLRHLPVRPEAARAALETAEDGHQVFRLRYLDIARELTITFESDFPHVIEGWTETSGTGWGPLAKRLTTTAIRKERILEAYWNRNSRADAGLRQRLGLD